MGSAGTTANRIFTQPYIGERYGHLLNLMQRISTMQIRNSQIANNHAYDTVRIRCVTRLIVSFLQIKCGMAANKQGYLTIFLIKTWQIAHLFCQAFLISKTPLKTDRS